MLEFLGGLLLTAILAIMLASSISDGLAPILESAQEWMNKKYGFPRNVKTGKRGMLNKIAVVESKFRNDAETGKPTGKVTLNGELWNAISDTEAKLAPGDEVTVSGVEGLTLRIQPNKAL